MDGDTILTRDRSSGKVHKRIRQGVRLMVDERCNLDDAGRFLIIPDVSDVDAESLCRFCFATINEPANTGAG